MENAMSIPPLIQAPDGGERICFPTTLNTIRARAAATGGAYGLIEAVAPPGASPPLHVHTAEEESFYVLEGELTIRCGEELFRVGPGAFACLPRGVPHSFVVEGERPARFLNVITPGGMEEFFAAVGSPAGGEGLPPAAPPDIDRLVAVGNEFGIETVGPPLAPQGAAR